MFRILIFCLAGPALTAAFAGLCHAQGASALNSGSWYKITVDRSGVYKIDASLMKKAGINPAGINPKHIAIYGNGGGMLPQQNDVPRAADLIENAIYVEGEADGRFDAGDYILFYAEQADRLQFDPQANAFFYEKNLYAVKNHYFLRLGDSDGKRVGTRNNEGNGFPVVRVFDDCIVHEVDTYNELKSGRDWFGEKFDLTTTRTFEFDISGIVPNTPIKLVTEVMAQSYTGSSFVVSVNGVEIGEQIVIPIPNQQYGNRGETRRDTLMAADDLVHASASASLTIRYDYMKASQGRSVGYLDYFVGNFKRALARYGDQTIFTSGESLANPITQFEITRPEGVVKIWDITDPLHPRQQDFQLADRIFFSTATDSLRRYILFNEKYYMPEAMTAIANQNLHGLATPNLLVVTHPSLLAAAQQLAQHRETRSGWSVATVTVDQIYNEFSSGRQDITAIRDFVRLLYEKDPGTFRAVLLFGKGSYDYKDRVSRNTNFVPIYESRNSLHPLLSYSSDDYYAFLEPGEGNWGEDPPEAATMDIAVGRLPVKTPAEAQAVVDKIIKYDNDTGRFGRWRKQLVFVADDGDFNIHQGQSDQLAEMIETQHPEFDTRKIFLDAFPQPVNASGEVSPLTNEAILNAFDAGALVINYSGHGNEQLWAQERILDLPTVQQLQNKKFPLMVTATCEFGRHDDPQFSSNGENLLGMADAGAIGLVSTSRLVQSSTNFQLNKAFYEALFKMEDGRFAPIGEVFRNTKNNSQSGISNRNFSLLGDPSLTLAMPPFGFGNPTIQTVDGSDTLKALSNVVASGMIVDPAGSPAVGFQGRVELTLFDKESERTTLGNENAPFAYMARANRLYSGSASVVDGTWALEFILPKNIGYAFGDGKLSLYAYDPALGTDARGVVEDMTIGSTQKNVTADNTPPVIHVYLGDSTFVDGGITGPDAYLFATLADASGISISTYGIGNGLVATLDEATSYPLDMYYEAALDDFTHGTIRFPLRNLAPGSHELVLRAWDTHNNPGRASVRFTVTNGAGLVVERFASYPNPFQSDSKLFFTHNHPGDDLTGQVILYNSQGGAVRTLQFEISSAPYWVNLMEFNRTDNILPGGIYLARLIVRSRDGGFRCERVTRLIISN